LLSLNHLTVPFAMKNTSLTTSRTGEEGAAAQTELALIFDNPSRLMMEFPGFQVPVSSGCRTWTRDSR
jgi:hypothetical protein